VGDITIQDTGAANPPGRRVTRVAILCPVMASAVTVSPAPTDEEAAAIVAAVDALWPRPYIDEVDPRRASAWKFSGRWWSQPMPLRRARPWT
jgi:hypothetical protein